MRVVRRRSPLYIRDHDDGWGVSDRDDRRLLGFFVLEGTQAGLSWLTEPKKPEHCRRAFEACEFERTAGYTEKDGSRLLADPGIARNHLKV